MEFKYNKKVYSYDPQTGIVTSKKGTPRNQEKLLQHMRKIVQTVQLRGYDNRMDYKAFDLLISTLSEDQKEELFHKVYEAYLYANHSIKDYGDGGEKGMPVADYFKVMAKIKRYEQYIYKIINS